MEFCANVLKNDEKAIFEMRELYQKYGRYLHTQQSFTCEGEQGMELMASIMKRLRKDPPRSFGDFAVVTYSDYKASETIRYATGERTPITLPKANALAYELEHGCSIIIRPSGTEPKIKVYYTMKAPTLEEAQEIEAKLRAAAEKLLDL